MKHFYFTTCPCLILNIKESVYAKNMYKAMPVSKLKPLVASFIKTSCF